MEKSYTPLGLVEYHPALLSLIYPKRRNLYSLKEEEVIALIGIQT